MKRLAVLSATLMGSTAIASAADLYEPVPAPVVTYEASSFDWTGIFGGLHGGYGGDHFEFPWQADFFGFDDEEGPRYLTGDADITSSGFFAGGQLGANWQFAPQWVVGVVGDAAWSDIKGELGLDVNIENPVGPGGEALLDLEAGSKVNWFGTIRGRIGFLPTERFMIYGTGGAAVGETESYLEASLGGGDGPGGEISTSDTEWGWSAGGGFEFAVTNNVTFGAEYLYVDLGDQTLDSGFTGGDVPSSIEVDTHFHSVKAYVNFLWGVGGGSGADLAPVEFVEAPSESMNWTGIFGGIHGGYGGDHFEYPWQADFFSIEEEPRYLSGDAEITSSGFFAGGQIGANWQFAPQWVVGVVADAAWSDIKGELGLDATYISPPDEEPLGSAFELFDVEAGSKINWFGTIRGRLGFLPTERFMVYGTGGAAVGETESYLEGSVFGESDEISTSDTEWGWSAGGGFNYAVTENVIVGAEYLYVDLGDQTLASGNTGGDVPSSIEVESHFHSVKVTLDYLFN